jgi:hypothetical protein
MKALKRTPVAPFPKLSAVDARQQPTLGAENERLRDLIRHCALHAAEPDFGYSRMDAAQRSLYDRVLDRSAGSAAVDAAPRVISAENVAAPVSGWRSCEYCGCRTNAAERICCRRGRDTDRRTWGGTAAVTA